MRNWTRGDGVRARAIIGLAISVYAVAISVAALWRI